MSVTVTLPDGKALELADGATGADAAAASAADLSTVPADSDDAADPSLAEFPQDFQHIQLACTGHDFRHGLSLLPKAACGSRPARWPAV